MMKRCKKNKLAIIGANEAITILIEKAKSLGYETHVFAWKCGDPGEKAADYFYPISLSNKDAILDKCREIGVCGVCSITSDFAAPVVAYVARKLGLPANPERTDIVARNKYEMRKAFEDFGGIYTPKYLKVTAVPENDELNDFRMPIIIKPTDRWSSKGITRVDNIEDVPYAVINAINESFDKSAIIEEFMEGPEYSAECIVYDGVINILAFTQKKTTGAPHYIETGHIQPSDITIDEQNRIKPIIERAIRALDITNSAAHVEFRVLKNGDIGFMEIGARMGGDYIGTDLTPISTGLDYMKMVIDVSCGNKPSFAIKSNPTPVEVRFIMTKKDIDDFNKIDKNLIVRKSFFNENFNNEIVDSSTRHGYYIVKNITKK